IEKLREKLDNNETVLCGPSGAGKSTLINTLTEKYHMETGEVSEKIGRGKHTTRHSELIDVVGGYIVDTPGFSTLEVNFIEKEDLRYSFPEFEEYNNLCKFRGCLHYKEPNCAVKKAVEEGKINKYRYDFYVRTLEEKMDGRKY
ncbi:ribosome small subunit-dependent GTPase A, partial [Clostridium saudiense]|nr:ribosome small subunit-dependent GTPase A [Clostridium saudiense]